MILYFSGTGNSLYIAKKMAEELNDCILSIAELVCKQQYELTILTYFYPAVTVEKMSSYRNKH